LAVDFGAGLLALLSDFRAIYFLSGVSLDQVRQRDGRAVSVPSNLGPVILRDLPPRRRGRL
jgi:hypothetical protein